METLGKTSEKGQWKNMDRPTSAEMISALRDRLPADLIGNDDNDHVEVGTDEDVDEFDHDDAADLLYSFVELSSGSAERVRRIMSAPGVAKEVVDMLSSDKALATKDLSSAVGWVIDALPLETQVQIMYSENGPHIFDELIKHSSMRGNELGKIVAKFSTILQWKLERGETEWVDDYITPRGGTLDYRGGAKRRRDDFVMSQLNNLQDKISEHIDADRQLDLVLKMGSIDEVADYLRSNPDAAANMDAAQAYLLRMISREAYTADGGEAIKKQILDMIPAPVATLINKVYVDGKNRDDKMSRLREINAVVAGEKLDRIAELRSDRNEMIWQRLWLTSIDEKIIFDGADGLMEEIAEDWPFDAETIKEIRCNMGGSRWEKYIEEHGIVPILSLDEVKNPKKMYLRHAELFLEQNKPSEVRDELCKGLYGVDVEELARTLISIGVIGSLSRKNSNAKDIIRNVGLSSESEISVHTEKINEAYESGAITEKEKIVLLESIRLLSTGGSFDEFFQILRERPDGETRNLSEILKRLTEDSRKMVTKKISEATSETLEKSTELVDTIEYDGKSIPVYRMVGDEFMVLGTVLHAFTHYGDNNNPEEWNRDNLGAVSEGRLEGGYISTSLFCDGRIKIAHQYSSPEDLYRASKENDLIIYAFTDLGESGVLHMASYDLFTTIDEGGVDTHQQDFFYDDLRELIAQTDEYNEVAVDRFAKRNEVDAPFEGRVQPGYLVCFAKDVSDISELAKKHAAYFGVPIVMIDPWKYWDNSTTIAKYKREKEMKKNGRTGSVGARAYGVYGQLSDS